MNYSDLSVQFQLSNTKQEDLIYLTCTKCGKQTTKRHKRVKQAIYEGSKIIYCSKHCSNMARITTIEAPCGSCGKLVTRVSNQVKKSKSGHVFCSNSCSATYINAHKVVGNRRSKLEMWLENQLTSLYPNLIFQFNRKDTIQSELDIYIPTLKLAFELNGIFHYEPIYGTDKLASILNNDTRKFQACLEQGIELCIIDSSKQIRFTEQSSKQYLDIIRQIINLKLSV